MSSHVTEHKVDGYREKQLDSFLLPILDSLAGVLQVILTKDRLTKETAFIDVCIMQTHRTQ